MSYRTQRRRKLQAIFQGEISDLNSRDASVKAIKKALRRGLIKRPKKCARCKSMPGVDAKGHPKIEAVHLNGHSKEHRFDFEWLCVSCRSRAVWAKQKGKL